MSSSPHLASESPEPKKALFIDADPEVRAMLVNILDPLVWSVRHAPDNKAALDVAHSRGDRPLRLLSREGKPRAAVFGDGLDGRERALHERLVEQGLRNEVRVGINNHVYLLGSFWPRSAFKDAGRDALPLRPRPPPNPLIVAFRSL